MSDFVQLVIAKYNYWMFIVLMMVGLYAIIVKNNLIKKIIGMNIVQTAIILFYISTSAKRGATLPIINHHGGSDHAVHAIDYINPLPHVLMLTAIVVSVATLGVALALSLNIYRRFNTLEMDEIRKQLKDNPKQ